MTEAGALVVALMGPTASGKTELAVSLARQLGGELINADSRQAIAEVAVATDKPTPAVLEGVPCRGTSWRRLGQPFSAAEFAELAGGAIQEVLSVGAVPILVGGTGLYLRALLEGFDFGSTPPGERPVDPDVKALGGQLLTLWPDTAVDLGNARRVTRALELARSGSRASSRPVAWRTVKIGCRLAQSELWLRIAARCERMMGPALLSEIERLLADGFSRETIGDAAIGYAEALAWADGRCTREEAAARAAARTRRYAKAQMTWLRKEPSLNWVEMDRGREWATAVCLRMVAQVKESIEH